MTTLQESHPGAARPAGKAAVAGLLADWSPVWTLALVLCAAVGITEWLGNQPLQSIVALTLIRIVTVVGLYIFIGNSGIVSFGQIAFMAIAAYASAWQTCCEALKPLVMPGLPDFLLAGSVPLWLSALSSIALAGGAAFLVGLALMGLSGLAASISTLAILFIFNTVYSNWDSVTMGTASIVGLPTYVTSPVALAAALVALVVAFVHQRSRWGLMLRASREDEVAARAAGVSLYWARLIAFTVSGLVLGLSGVLQAHFLGSLSTDSFFLPLTFITIAMLIVGGTGSLAGAVVGAVTVQAITEVFRKLESGVTIGGWQLALPNGVQELVLAAAMLLILVYRRNGLMGGAEFRFGTMPRGPARAGRM